jgi:hypothetical protein
MVGYLLLEGGAEFGEMAAPDRRAIELAGGPEVLISIIPEEKFLDKAPALKLVCIRNECPDHKIRRLRDFPACESLPESSR